MTTTEVKTNCKFCGRELVLPIGEEWTRFRPTADSLLPLVCCNECAKARETLRQTSFDIRDCCQKWEKLSLSMRNQVVVNVNSRLGKLLMDHLAALATIRGAQCPDFEQAIVDQLMDYPTKWFDTLKQAREIVKPQF